MSNQPKRNIKIKCPQIENITKNIEITLKRNNQKFLRFVNLKYTLLKKKHNRGFDQSEEKNQ